MSLEEQIADSIAEGKKVYDLVVGKFGEWDKIVKAKMESLNYNNIKTYTVKNYNELYKIARTTSVGGVLKIKASEDLKITKALDMAGGFHLDMAKKKLSFSLRDDANGAVAMGTNYYGNLLFTVTSATIEVANNVNSDTGSTYHTPFRAWLGKLRLILYSSTIELNTGFLITHHSAGVSELHLKGCIIKKGENFDDGKLVRASGRKLIVYRYSVTLEDDLEWEDIVDNMDFIEFR